MRGKRNSKTVIDGWLIRAKRGKWPYYWTFARTQDGAFHLFTEWEKGTDLKLNFKEFSDQFEYVKATMYFNEWGVS